MSEDIHPVDHALGEIHEAAICLAHQRYYDMAKRLAEAHEAIQAYLIKEPEPKEPEPKTIEQRLLFVAQELKSLDDIIDPSKPVEFHVASDALDDIFVQEYDRAIAKLTGEWDPTPKDEDAWSGGICENH